MPRLFIAGLHNLVAQLLLSGVPVFIAGESAHVKVTVPALKATVAEDMYQCDVSIYNLSTRTLLYTSTSRLVSICSATAFDTRLPRYMACTEGPMSSMMPVEMFSFLLSVVPVITPPHFTLSWVRYPPHPHNPLRWHEWPQTMVEGDAFSCLPPYYCMFFTSPLQLPPPVHWA